MSVAGRNQGTAAHPLELNIYAGLLELPGVESHPKTPTHGLILGRFLVRSSCPYNNCHKQPAA